MRWIKFLLLGFCIGTHCYGQGELYPKQAAQAAPAVPNIQVISGAKIPEDSSALADIQATETAGSTNSGSKSAYEASQIQLSMIVLEANAGESYNPDAVEVRREVEKLAQDIKNYFDKDNAEHGKTERLGTRRRVDQNKNITELVKAKPGMTLLSRPNMVTELGVAASTKMGQSISLPYLERIDAETFKLRHTPAGHLGIDISVTPKLGITVTDYSNNETNHVFILSPIVLSVSAIDGREKVDGVDLPIGKPIVTRRTIETSLTLEEGEPGIIALPVAEGKHVFMIVFVRQVDR